jgi:hypothetical protein
LGILLRFPGFRYAPRSASALRSTLGFIRGARVRGLACQKRCEVVGRELVVMPENMQQRGFSPTTIPLADRDILEIIRGEVVWIGREL